MSDFNLGGYNPNNYEPSEHVLALLKRAEYVVEECDNAHKFFLWKLYAKQSDTPHFSKADWKENRDGGYGPTVGHFAGMPVNVSILIHNINGVEVLFMNTISMVNHSEMVKKWMTKYCKCYAENHTDPANFHNMLHFAQRKREVKEVA